MLVKILITIAVLIALLLVVAAMQPSTFHVTPSATIPAPVPVVFAQVNDLHAWEDWSPWAKIDPNCKKIFEGPRAGTGAVFAWAGNNKVGEGRMEITESRPNELIRFNLKFLKPFKANNLTEFTFKPEGNQTLVSWSMTGQRNLMFKAVGLFMNCDKMVGGDFEKGLAQMKSTVALAAARQ
jgi:hypothetical protein